MSRTKSAGKAGKSIPSKALLSIVVNAKTARVPDRQLREWTDRAWSAMWHLLEAARISGRIELVHDAEHSQRLIHVEAKAKVHSALQLFDEPDPPRPLDVKDAGEIVIRQAKAELVRFMKKQQAIALSELEAAASRVRASRDELNHHLIGIVRSSERGEMHVRTHGSDYVLTCQTREGDSEVDAEAVTILAKVEWVGKDVASIRPLDASRKKHPWLRRALTVNFMPAQSGHKSMLGLYWRGVREGRIVTLRGIRVQAKQGHRLARLQIADAVEFASPRSASRP